MASPTNTPSTAVDPLGTWAGRNPDKPVIPPRKRAKRSLTDAQKATQAEKRALNDASAKQLDSDVRRLKQEIEGKLEEIANKYNKKASYIRDLFYQKAAKQALGINLWNAKLHWMANKRRKGAY